MILLKPRYFNSSQKKRYHHTSRVPPFTADASTALGRTPIDNRTPSCFYFYILLPHFKSSASPVIRSNYGTVKDHSSRNVYGENSRNRFAREPELFSQVISLLFLFAREVRTAGAICEIFHQFLPSRFHAYFALNRCAGRTITGLRWKRSCSFFRSFQLRKVRCEPI